MSPGSRLLTELRLTFHGHQVVVYVPLGRRHGDRTTPAEPVHWWISVDDGPPFPGPAYRGQTLAEAAETQAELEAFLESHPKIRNTDTR
jgi:hypothetical protein